MSFIDKAKELLNKTFTLNGDIAYKSSGSLCLDYFALIGGYRNELINCQYLFYGAFLEDRINALKLLFYTRDAKNGAGERNIFRFLLNLLGNSYPEIATKLIPYIPNYGRYDDLFSLISTPAEDELIKFISNTLDKDIKNKKENKPITLLSKWMPSINTSNDDARKLANHLCIKLGMSKKEYRQTLSFLRKGIIIENNLRENDYSFDYSAVPSQAMLKYRNAFYRNDMNRYKYYLLNVFKSNKDMNVKLLDIVLFIKRIKSEYYLHGFNTDYYNAAWKELVNEGEINKKTLVVRDGSGSMYSNFNYSPIHIADAISLLTAARLTGPFKDKFITFSANPEFVDLSRFNKIEEKVEWLSEFDDCSNTDIEKVFNLIYDVYNSKDFTEEDALDQIMIISDMQFDLAVGPRFVDSNNREIYNSTYENFKLKFAENGFKLPEVIFWNCNSYGTLPVMMDEKNVKLISGANKNLIDLVTKTDSLDPKDFMDKTLKNYDFIDELFPEGV